MDVNLTLINQQTGDKHAKQDKGKKKKHLERHVNNKEYNRSTCTHTHTQTYTGTRTVSPALLGHQTWASVTAYWLGLCQIAKL